MKAKSIPYSQALAALALTAGLALGLSRPAHAGGADVFWSVTMSSPGVHVGVANGPVVMRERVYVPRVVHAHPPVVYAPPRVVHVPPRVVYGHPGRHHGHYQGRGHDRHDRHDWHRHDRRDRDDDRRHGGRGRGDDRDERHGGDRGERGGQGHRLAQR